MAWYVPHRIQKDFYIDEEMIVESIQRNSSFNIIHRETMFKVDVFIPRPRPYGNQREIRQP